MASPLVPRIASAIPSTSWSSPTGSTRSTPARLTDGGTSAWTPYVGFAVGASFPHVEIRRTGSDIRTFGYQLTGVAVEGLVGVEYHIGPRVSAFADYKLSFSSKDADVRGGGTLDTDLWTNHIIFGLSYRFGAAPAAGYIEPAPPY